MSTLLKESEMLAWTTAAQRKAGEVQQANAIRELPGAVVASALTIASGSITPVQAHHLIDTESATPSDDLDTIDQSVVDDGRIVILSTVDASRAVTLKNGHGGTGQIFTSDGADLVLDSPNIMVALIRRGAAWYELSRSMGFASDAQTVAGSNASLATTSRGVLACIKAHATIPGAVIAFSGTFGGPDNRNPIPRNSTTPDTGWLLCDGGDDGSGGTVPDLRGRMILSASSTHAAGTTGGAESHTHTVSGTVGATTLTEAQMPSHCHTYPWYNNSGGGPAGVTNNTRLYQDAVSSSYTGGSNAHSHTFAGTSAMASSMPPYYAMAYIIRL